MRLGPVETLITIAMLVIGTVITRALPFFIFPTGKKIPVYVTYPGSVLPFAMMGFLMIYSLKGISLITAPYGLPELVSIAAIAGLHLWKNNTMLSIGAGTAIYMLLIS